jgi:hypothetical protein
MLDSLGLKYEITSIDSALRDIAACIEVQTNPRKNTQIFRFPLSAPAAVSEDEKDVKHAPASGKTEHREGIDKEGTCRSILTTDPALFALLRIRKD